MWEKLLGRSVMLAVLAWCGHAAADDSPLRATIGKTALTANGAISGQTGAFTSLETGRRDQASEWDASLVLNAERVADNGLVMGLRLEVDTGDRRVEDLQRDEIYAYLSGGFGRIELGEQDGAADTLALHAPIVGLGQVRGDFVRYTGSPALLTPFDTRDSLKIVYLSAPVGGLRFGVSYAPVVESNADDPNPRRRTRQENGVEAAVAYQTPVAGAWALGVSAAYVTASADPITERQDIESWSIGTELGRDELTLGAAYVSRGDSNVLTPGFDETEWNAGAAWRGRTWGAGLSGAVTESSSLKTSLVGVGGYRELGRWWVVRADIVNAKEQRATRTDKGLVGLAEISFRF